MYIYMGERIAGKQDRSSLIIEDPLMAPKIPPKYNIFFTFWPINEKLVFKLFSLVVHMSPLWWGLRLLTFWCPWYPWILCKGPTWPRTNIFYFNSKGSYQIASSLIIETPPPPPPPGPHIAKDVNMFSHICKTYYPLFFPCCAYVSSLMWSSWHFSTSGFNIYASPGNENENKNLKKFSSDYFHILHIVELLVWFSDVCGALKHIYIKCLGVLLTNVYWFRATGGYICSCGRPSNPVILSFSFYQWLN